LNVLRTHNRLSELDELIEAWPGSPLHPLQVSPGPLDLSLDAAVSEDLAVLRLSLAPRLIDFTVVTRTEFVLVEQPMISMGVHITPPALLVNHSGREYRSVLEPGFRSIEFMVGDARLETELLGQLLADPRAREEHTIVPLTAERAAELKVAASAYIAAAESPDRSEFTACLEAAVEDRIFRLLTRVLQNHQGLEPSSIPARVSVALAALRRFERYGYDQSLKDVCSHLGVSRRTVEKSFQALLGISPAQYLLAQRLNHFRRSLLGPAHRVADGLADAGLADASRAARQYQRLFDELPSATLTRAQARVAVH
jgi:AraC-like DNA-binding protein